MELIERCIFHFISEEIIGSMEEWDPAINDFVLRCNSCWRTDKQTCQNYPYIMEKILL
jgi:hypothetical protein